MNWPYMAHANDLLNFEWSFEKSESMHGNKIYNFCRKTAIKYIDIDISANTREKYYDALNNIISIAEKDILAGKQGKLYLGKRYVSCNIYAVNTDDWNFDNDIQEKRLKIIIPNPAWIEETTIRFDRGQNEEEYFYPYDFPYDYPSGNLRSDLKNSHYVACDFKMTIYGSCTNPMIYIGDNTYQLDYTIGEKEYVTIDSKEGTIVLTKENGDKVNIFAHRNTNYNIFSKIPAGISPVTWESGVKTFDVIVISERGEPDWTEL